MKILVDADELKEIYGLLFDREHCSSIIAEPTRNNLLKAEAMFQEIFQKAQFRKILVDREDIDNVRESLSKIRYHLEHSQYIERTVVKDLTIESDDCLLKMFRNNPESTFPVYRSCPQCGKTIYLTDPHKCNVIYKRIDL